MTARIMVDLFVNDGIEGKPDDWGLEDRDDLTADAVLEEIKKSGDLWQVIGDHNLLDGAHLYVQVVHEVDGRTVRSHAEWNGE